MFTLVYVVCAAGQATLAIIAIRLFLKRKSLSALMLILPIAAVVWDNAIVALGAAIGEGPTLVALSWPRFIGHALFTPAWIMTGIGFAWRAGAKGFGTRAMQIGQWLLYAICVVFGTLRSVIYLKMEPATEGGLLYYRNAGSFPGPPIGSILMLLVVLACAVVVWRLTKSPWMFLGAVFMLIAAVLPQEIAGFVFANTGELVMALSLVVTEYLLQKRPTSAPEFEPSEAYLMAK
ncbi:MAG: hypothetical protein LBE83_07525 [Propionibacteriaceae bacterium]|jgi:hypothetical protein|nr:hypothetical protein [Propionibacteriaceae bacterium]